MPKFFVNRPIVAIVIAIITLIAGLVSMFGLPIAQFPEIVPPQIIMSTSYTGADALTIEQAVAAPLEQQMNGVDNMLYMQSINANDGTMSETVTFDVQTDVEPGPGEHPEPGRPGPAVPAPGREPERHDHPQVHGHAPPAGGGVLPQGQLRLPVPLQLRAPSTWWTRSTGCPGWARC